MYSEIWPARTSIDGTAIKGLIASIAEFPPRMLLARQRIMLRARKVASKIHNNPYIESNHLHLLIYHSSI